MAKDSIPARRGGRTRCGDDRHPLPARLSVNRLRREGWTKRRGKGSHVVFIRSGRPLVVVADHRRELSTRTPRSLARPAGWEWPVRRD